MIDKLQSYSKNEGFFSSKFEEFKIKIKKIQKSKSEIIVFGLSHMLLEFIENKKIKLNNCIVIETGGMKGNREEIEKRLLSLRIIGDKKISLKSLTQWFWMES